MVLLVVARDKMYFDIRFEDVPQDYILGGICFVCCRKGPIDRARVEQRWGATSLMRHVDDHLHCIVCGNRTANRFTIVGRKISENDLDLPGRQSSG